MSDRLTDEKREILTKYGFIVGQTITHKKTGALLDVKTVEGCPTSTALEKHIKDVLRSQCFLRNRAIDP